MPQRIATRRTSVLLHDDGEAFSMLQHAFDIVTLLLIPRTNTVSMKVADVVKSAIFEGRIDDLKGYLSLATSNIKISDPKFLYILMKLKVT